MAYKYRYSNWLSTGLAARKFPNSGSNPGSEWAVSAALDDLVYVRFLSRINFGINYYCGIGLFVIFFI